MTTIAVRMAGAEEEEEAETATAAGIIITIDPETIGLEKIGPTRLRRT